MSDSNGRPSRSDKIARDADSIAGFFGTRAGMFTTVGLVGGAIIFGLLSWLLP